MIALHLVKTAVGATWALRQMAELVRLGVEVHAALPLGPMVERYTRAGVRTHMLEADLPVKAPWQLPGRISRLQALIEAIRPDVIHSHFVGSTALMRLALRDKSNIPRFFQVPGPLHLEHPVFRAADLLSADERDFWIGSCRWTCERYKSLGVSGEKVFLAYYGPDAETFVPAAPGALRRELGLSAATEIVGMVAYMYAPKRFLGQSRGLKGHEDLIEAFQLIASKRSNAVVVFVGGAWGGAHSYEARVRAYGERMLGQRAYFLGSRTDVPALYTDFDVAVHPSHSENVGGAAESLLLAVPTVASAVGGLPDVVVDGSTGWLVPPKQPHELAEAIKQVLEDRHRARERARAGQRLARELLDIGVNARSVLSAYEAGRTRLGAVL